MMLLLLIGLVITIVLAAVIWSAGEDQQQRETLEARAR
jgi:hypothetical protein